MISAIIVEDQDHCVRRLEKLISENASNINILQVYDNVPEAIIGTNAQKPDLVFLDIEIKDQTGFDYLEGLEYRDFTLIFTTSHNTFYKQALKYSAVDYLEKPIDEMEFNQMINRYNQIIAKAYNTIKIDHLLANTSKPIDEKKILTSYNGRVSNILIKDILYVKSEERRQEIVTKKISITVSESLDFYDKLFSSFSFFRIHRSSIVNLMEITSYQTNRNNIYVTLSNNEVLEVSARRKSHFIKAFKALKA